MTPPAILVDLVKESEGFHKIVQRKPYLMAAPYLCPAGFWTIGYGVLCAKDRAPITLQQGEAELAELLPKYMNAAVKQSPRILETEGRLTAITDFVFNLGPTRYAGSTLKKAVNAGDWEWAKREIVKWVWGGGKKLSGLVIRRNIEASLL